MASAVDTRVKHNLLQMTLCHMKTFDRKEQTDFVILDFSKAFVTVPHQKLLHKLNNSGIDGKVNNWICGLHLHSMGYSGSGIS